MAGEVTALDRDRRAFACGELIAIYRFDGTWSAGLVTELQRSNASGGMGGHLRMRLFLGGATHTSVCSFIGVNDYIMRLGEVPTGVSAAWLVTLYPELAAVLGSDEVAGLQQLLAH